jgi:ribosome-associated heat shock protein Hsp15
MPLEIDAVRLDKWLWVARFFKSRKLAAEAIAGGKVHLNGQRTKPGKDIKIGDELIIYKSGYSWEICITAITGQRRSAKDAGLLYQETPESLAKRQQQLQELRDHKELLGFSGADQKPDKRQRRLIYLFKQRTD